MCCKHLNRRSFIGLTGGAIAGAGLISPSALLARGEAAHWDPKMWDPDKPFAPTGKALRIQPVLMYTQSQRREAASWKSWGGIQTHEAASEEVERITKELASLSETADFPLEVLPVAKVTTPEEAAKVQEGDFDTLVLYPARGGGELLRSCFSKKGDTVIFVRHRSGPVYYWYEALSVAYLKTGKEGEEPWKAGDIYVDDVVVDDSQELLWRLRALCGVKNFLGSRIVALGGVWGKYSGEAPEVARKKYGLDIIEIGYDQVEDRIKSAIADKDMVSRAEEWTDKFLSMPNTTLMTERPFVVNAFVLYGLFKDLMRENDAPAFTIRECMSTILPMSQTTACLSLGLMNDEGLLAFCESDFVVIPSGILLHHISRKPVFMHNSTFPHEGLVTCAHCSAPRRMDADRYEPMQVLTHYESEYGAAPKVEIPEGQEVSFIDPEYSTGRWVGFKGTVESNPFLEICRSQQDVQIHGDWKKLIKEVRDSHWMMVYGDYLKEVGYASRRIGIEWEDISSA